MAEETTVINNEQSEVEQLRAALATAKAEEQLYIANVTRLEEEGERWLKEADDERSAHAETRKALEEELRAGMTAHEHRTLRTKLAKAVTMLKRWRADGSTDHRLPGDTVQLLQSLGEQL